MALFEKCVSNGLNGWFDNQLRAIVSWEGAHLEDLLNAPLLPQSTMRYPIRPMRRFVSGLLACLAWLQSISAYITTEDGFGYVSDTDVSQV